MMDAFIPNRLNWEKKQLYERCWHFTSCLPMFQMSAVCEFIKDQTHMWASPSNNSRRQNNVCTHVSNQHSETKVYLYSELSSFCQWLLVSFSLLFHLSLSLLSISPSFSDSKEKSIRITVGHDKHLWDSKNFLFIHPEPGPLITQNTSSFLNLISRFCYHS